MVFEAMVGPIADGMVVDHRCHNRACVNPAHLQLATPKQNNENRAGANSNNVSTGVLGVWWNGRNKRYEVRVRHRYVGCYASLADAEAAAIAERNEVYTNNLRDRTETHA
jgi:hypothetical protein